MFGSPSIRFDVFDGQLKLMHLRKLHKAVEKTLLDFPFDETDDFVSLITSEPWDKPVDDETRHKFHSSKSIEAKVLARFHRQSALSVAYAVFEFSFLELAMDFCSELKADRNPKDLRDRGVNRAKSLFSLAGHDLQVFTSSSWNECLDIALVRNKVMHSGGLVPTKERAKFTKIRGVHLEDFADGEHMLQVCVDGDYVLRAFRIFEELLETAKSEVERILNAHS